VRRIVAFQTLGIGDTVATEPALAAMKRAWPGARLDLVVAPAPAGLVPAIEAVDGGVVFAAGVGPISRLLALRRLGRRLRRRGYDVAVGLDPTLGCALAAWWSGAPVRVGYDSFGRGFAYTHSVPAPVTWNRPRWEYAGEITGEPQADSWVRMLEAVGIEGERRPPRLRADGPARAEIDLLMETAGLARDARPIIFYIGGRPSRRWAAERFALVGESLLETRGGPLVVAAGREDAERAEEIADAVAPDATLRSSASLRSTRAVAIADQSLAGLVALMERARIVVSHDSAAAHIAAAVGAPTVVIGGATDPDIWGPYGERARMVYDPDLPCLGCKSAECSAARHECMEAVTPEMVLGAIEEIGAP